MKLQNTTKTPRIPDYAIRRMTSFCCRVLGMRVGEISELMVRNRSDGETSGRCWLRTGRIVVSVGMILTDCPGGGAVRDPDWPELYRRTDPKALRHRCVKLLGVLAHEVAHRYTYLQGAARGPRNGHPGCCEKNTQWHADVIMRAFRDPGRDLLTEWLAEPAKPEPVAAKPKKDQRRVRAQKDAELLKTWERKLALARTKVSKYKRKVSRARRDGLLDERGTR